MIDARFTTAIYVQIGTTVFGGGTTWADRAGHNMGYVRTLNYKESVAVDKAVLVKSRKAVMTTAVVPVYGQRLRAVEDGVSKYYMVKNVDPQKLSGGGFQTVDCEVVI